ncbi:MAG: homoserine kinase [Nocardiaceae bacterium]|nr:homoserine kinase [Nocardiaceae bacterium]
MTVQLPSGLNVTARVPASSANLGPGFDSLGLALSLYDEISVTTTDGGLSVEVEGEGAGDVPADASHLVVRAIERGFEALGVQASGMNVLCRNKIPHSRGLGSSASAVVGGLAAAEALAKKFDSTLELGPELLVQLSSEFEGHPDNAAASVLGGVVVSWTEEIDGAAKFSAVRVEPHPDLRLIVLVPTFRSSTAQTRGILPPMVPHKDASFNVSRAALSVVALTQRPDLLMAATEDRLHQGYRASALPITTRWIAALRKAGIPAVVSGAGPTVLAFSQTSMPDALRIEIEAEGLTVLELPISDGVSAG